MRVNFIGKQVEAYQGAWRDAHDKAMDFWDFQDNLQVGIQVFSSIGRRNLNWRQRVSTGMLPFSPEDDSEVRKLLEGWLQPSDDILKRLDSFETEFGPVEGGNEFRRCRDEARMLLGDWVPPALSAAPGLHAVELSSQEGKKLATLLESGAARPRIEPRSI